MTFYRNFKNKTEVASLLLQDIVEESTRKYNELMSGELSFPEKVARMILMKQENAKGISVEFLQDIYTTEGPLKDMMTNFRQDFESTINRDFTKAQEEGWIRKDMSMEFIFYMLEVVNREITKDEFLALHKDPEEGIMEMTKFFFYGIIDKIKAKG